MLRDQRTPSLALCTAHLHCRLDSTRTVSERARTAASAPLPTCLLLTPDLSFLPYPLPPAPPHPNQSTQQNQRHQLLQDKVAERQTTHRAAKAQARDAEEAKAAAKAVVGQKWVREAQHNAGRCKKESRTWAQELTYECEDSPVVAEPPRTMTATVLTKSHTAIVKPACTGVTSTIHKALTPLVPSPIPLTNALGISTAVAVDNLSSATCNNNTGVASAGEEVPPPLPPTETTIGNCNMGGLRVAVALVAGGPVMVSFAAGVGSFAVGFRGAQTGLHAGLDMMLSALPITTPLADNDNDNNNSEVVVLTPQQAAVGDARRNVTAHVVNLSGGVLTEDGALLQAAGDALEAGAHLALDAAVNLTAAGCAAACAGVGVVVASTILTPLVVGAGLLAGGRALWRSISGGRA